MYNVTCTNLHAQKSVFIGFTGLGFHVNGGPCCRTLQNGDLHSNHLTCYQLIAAVAYNRLVTHLFRTLAPGCCS